MDTAATVLLRRTRTAHLPDPADGPTVDPSRVAVLEGDLVVRGWIPTARLRDALGHLDRATFGMVGDWLLATLTATTAEDRDHVPLFRAFPDVPASVHDRIADRMLVAVLQGDDIPCVLCGRDDLGRPLGCGHPICPGCFDPAAYTGCPVCGQRTTGPLDHAVVGDRTNPPVGVPVRVVAVDLADQSVDGHATTVRDDLAGRPGTLADDDLTDLTVLARATAPATLDWIPDTAAKQTVAALTADLLHRTAATDGATAAISEAASTWTTATDVARTLWTHAGGRPDLTLPRAVHGLTDTPKPRVRALPRPLRRAALTPIGTSGPAQAAEEMGRHPTIWKRLLERLHPFEQPGRHPAATVAAACLRQTRCTGRVAAIVRDAAAADPDRLRLVEHDDGTVTVTARTFLSAVEDALGHGDTDTAARLLGDRPGMLWRRLDHLARTAAGDPATLDRVAAFAAAAAPTVGPAVLAAAAASIDRRHTTRAGVERTAVRVKGSGIGLDASGGTPVFVRTGGEPVAVPMPPGPDDPTRTFLPSGDTARVYSRIETRPPLPEAFCDAIRAAVDSEMARRGPDAAYDLAVLDAALADVPLDSRAAASAATADGWTRGTVRPLGDTDVLRLFLHWVETPDTDRVDLDLSVNLYDNDWNLVAVCDYTNLDHANGAARHSGDLTSAPPPGGATEYLDLDIPRLVAAGAAWAVPSVFAYTSHAFDELAAATCGFMLPTDPAVQFDAARVVTRFDLRGRSRQVVPLIADLTGRRAMWADIHPSGSGWAFNAMSAADRTGRAAADTWRLFTGGTRPTVLDLAVWHTTGRARRVVLAHADGTTTETGPDARVIRDAVAAGSGTSAPVDTGGLTVFAAASAADGLPTRTPAAGSVALVADGGDVPAGWARATVAGIYAGLVPVHE